MNLTEKHSVLLVDDRPEKLLALKNLLSGPELNILTADSGNGALGLMVDRDFALVLLHVHMPDMDGFEVAELMKGTERTKDIPIIFVTSGVTEEKNMLKGCESVVVDYLFEPLVPELVRCKVRVFLELQQQKLLLEQTAQDLKKKVNELNEYRKVIESQNMVLNELSIKDGLTGLYNHHHMEEVLVQEFARAERYRTNLSCLLMDLDYFKTVNDTFGHAFGDFVLKEFSARMKSGTRESDFSFRYGGEEFMALLPNTDLVEAKVVAEKIRKLCENMPYSDGKDSKEVTISIGLASVKEHAPDDERELLAYADKALYQAKAEGRNRVNIYSVEPVTPASIGEEHKDLKHVKYLKEQISSILEKTKRSSVSSLELMVRDLGSPYLQEHNMRVLGYIDLVCNRLRLPNSIMDTLKRSASLHDCFKILLGDTLTLQMKSLTDEEQQRIEDHPYMLAELTDLFDFFANERSILLYHHENYDGSGYPEGLKEGQIPLGAKIFAIADSFVSMTSKRPHRDRLSVEEAKRELLENSGVRYDPNLVNIFLDIVEKEQKNRFCNGLCIT